MPDGPLGRLIPPSVSFTLKGPPAELAKLYEALKVGEIDAITFGQKAATMAREEVKARTEAMHA